MRRFVVPILLAASATHAIAQTAVHPLPREIADVRWNVRSTVFGDFVCRGGKDMAMYGTSSKSGFVVMIQPARTGSKPSYLIFATRDRDAKNMRLKIESLDFAGDEAFQKEMEYAAPGLVSSKTCKGLSLGDGETDSSHIFWNRNERVFQAWSL